MKGNWRDRRGAEFMRPDRDPGYAVDPLRFEFNDEGEFVMSGRENWREAFCAVCGEEIKWSLDMFSFTTGDSHKLAHAVCVWEPHAFDAEKEAAIQKQSQKDTSRHTEGT